MNAEPATLVLWLRAIHLTAIACWMAGQVWSWRLQIARTRMPGGLRRVLDAGTTLAATLALFAGAGLLAL